MAVAATGTYAALNVTTLTEMRGRIEGLVQQNQRLTQYLQVLQARYDNAMASRDDDISKRVNEMSSVWRDSLSALSARYEDVLKENQELENTRSAADSGERRRAAELKESKLSALNTVLLSNSNRIAVHQPLNLTFGKIKLGGRITAAKTFFNNSLNDGKAVKLFVRHGHQHQQRSPRKGGKRAASGRHYELAKK